MVVAASARVGWEAGLELAYARAGARTVPTHRRHFGPLRVQKHFEPEPGVCQHVIVHPPAGMAGGDHLRLDLAVGPGAHAQLTNPGATPWYRAESPARQTLHATVASGGVLELLPREHILFDGARAGLATTLELAADARAIAWEAVVLGRRHGPGGVAQPFARGSIDLTTRVLVGGELRLMDRLRCDAGDRFCHSPLGLAGAEVIVTLLAIGPDLTADTIDALRALATNATAASQAVRAGVSQLPGVAVARWLGAAIEPARQWLEAAWAVIRPDLIGRPAHPPRIWRT